MTRYQNRGLLATVRALLRRRSTVVVHRLVLDRSTGNLRAERVDLRELVRR